VQSVRRAHLLAALAAAAVVAVVAVVLLVPGSGSSGRAAASTPDGYRKEAVRIGGVGLQSARCKHWVGANPSERAAVVDVLRDVVGGPTPYGPATTLSADDTRTLFDRRCAHSYARGFLLYELLTRASAFSGAMDRFQ
jgi:hypothetical protein